MTRPARGGLIRAVTRLFHRRPPAAQPVSPAAPPPIRYHDGTERAWTEQFPTAAAAEVARLTAPLPESGPDRDVTAVITGGRAYRPRHAAPDLRGRRGPRVRPACPQPTQHESQIQES